MTHSNGGPPLFLSKDEILGATSLPTEIVPLPEIGNGQGSVMVQGLSATARDALEASFLVGSGKKQRLSTENIRAKYAKACVVHPETREPLFTEGEIVALGRVSAAALDRIYATCLRLSGVSEEDVAEIKNASASGRSGDS